MTFQDISTMIFLIIAIAGIFGSLAIAIVTDHMTKKQEELRKKTKKKRVVHRPDNERINYYQKRILLKRLIPLSILLSLMLLIII